MAYQKKTWLARLGQGLNKFIFNGGSKVTLDSSPDVVTQEGTPLSAENMNDFEQRIDDEFTNVNEAITSLNQAVSVSIQQPVTKLIDTISFSEYCYYSKFGRLVIVDIGGVLFPTAPSDSTAWLDGLPVQRTRPVAELFNNSDRTKSIDVFGEVGTTHLRVTRAIASTNFWGQVIYLTD